MTTETTPKLQTVGAIMTSRVVTIAMDDSLEVLRNIFQKVKFHHLIVADEGKIVGVISDRDFFKAISPYVGTMSETLRDRATLEKRAHQIMSPSPVTVQKNCPIQQAARLMLDRSISCLPVILSDGTIAGVVTWKDVFKVFLDPLDSTN
ncbi:MAG: CBS domain-containing protein [Nitrospirae bacterium]|nr:CBS domain-containing protein [Nitrospirota bacterium]